MYFVPAYDTELIQDGSFPSEVKGCLDACERIAQVHIDRSVPATFFILGRLLKEQGAEFRDLLDHDLFEIASHSYTHKLLADHPVCGPAASKEEISEEIVRGKALVEETFGRECRGFRPGCGFADGLDEHPDLLEEIASAGYRYVSADLWGPDYSLPAPAKPPRRYEEKRYEGLWELPACGWHENLLKGNNRIFGPEHADPVKILRFPPELPDAIPNRLITTAEEEFGFNNRPHIESALRKGHPFASLIWHPWSLELFDPEMRMLELTFDFIGGHPEIEFTTYDLIRSALERELSGRSFGSRFGSPHPGDR